MNLCSIKGCGSRVHARTWCSMHYTRWLRHGDPEKLKFFKKLSIKERFEEKYMPVTETGCWLWTDSDVLKGYGRLRIDGDSIRAHRMSWELHIGPIPDGLCVLHKCDVRCCVNPDHLFLGTNADNNEDMIRKGRDDFNGHKKAMRAQREA